MPFCDVFFQDMVVIRMGISPYNVCQKNGGKSKFPLDKSRALWYNKSCVEREQRKRSLKTIQ